MTTDLRNDDDFPRYTSPTPLKSEYEQLLGVELAKFIELRAIGMKKGVSFPTYINQLIHNESKTLPKREDPLVAKKRSIKYPSVICYECGCKYGKHPVNIATWYPATCQVCWKDTTCTEPRDFGHLYDGWQNEI